MWKHHFWLVQVSEWCFIYNAGLDIYFWLSFVPAIVSPPTFFGPLPNWNMKWSTIYFLVPKLVMVVGTKLQHVVSVLALEIAEPKDPLIIGTQVKPRDELFWFGKPKILLRLIQFISFQVKFSIALVLHPLFNVYFMQNRCKW